MWKIQQEGIQILWIIKEKRKKLIESTLVVLRNKTNERDREKKKLHIQKVSFLYITHFEQQTLYPIQPGLSLDQSSKVWRKPENLSMNKGLLSDAVLVMILWTNKIMFDKSGNFP